MPTATEEQIDAALDEAQGEPVTVETPDGPVEFGTPEALPDPDPEAIAVAEHEGLPPVPEATAGAEAATVDSETEAEDDDASAALKVALSDMYAIMDRLEGAKSDLASASEEHKEAKKYFEGLQEDFLRAARVVRNAKIASQPDPKRYPLLDKPKDVRDATKAEIDASFPKPDSIPPLPADDFDEEYRRRANATRLDGLGLKAATVAVLHAEGLHTMGDVTRYGEAGKRLDLVKNGEGSITEKRLTEVSDKLADIGMSWKAEWDAAHPEATPEAEATEAPAEAGEVANAEA